MNLDHHKPTNTHF